MYPIFKRLIDIFFATLLLCLLSPIMLIVSTIIAITMGRPVIFSQARIGFHNNFFNVYKFRTMKTTRNSRGELLPDHERRHFLGAIIRSFSLDELPQLINIINGTMSFIGPRPLITEYGPLYSDAQRKRHNVTPGISGWAQVKGRNSLTWEEKFNYDLYYVNHQSLLLDTKIFFLTLYTILNRKGVNQESTVTMAKFNGKN